MKFKYNLLLIIPLLGLLISCSSQCEKGEKGEQGIPGETGPQGPEGPSGENGTDGQDGLDGTRVMTGHGTPHSDLGNLGDSYIDLDTWNYYVKNANGWQLEGNIKGYDGTDGQDGKIAEAN